MGVENIAGRSVRKADLEDSAVESIKRNDQGVVQHQQHAKFSGTTTNATDFTLTTSVSRAFASNVALTINTTNTAGGSATISGPAGDTATTAIGNGNTTTMSNTFTQAPATWTLSLSVTTGTATITSWTVSREDERG